MTGAEVATLPLKRESPPYVAVKVTLPPVRGVHVQLPAPDISVMVHPPPAPPETTTVPVGVPVAGATAATVTDTVVGVPRTYGVGEIDVIAVVVLPFTVRVTGSDVEPVWTVVAVKTAVSG